MKNQIKYEIDTNLFAGGKYLFARNILCSFASKDGININAYRDDLYALVKLYQTFGREEVKRFLDFYVDNVVNVRDKIVDENLQLLRKKIREENYPEWVEYTPWVDNINTIEVDDYKYRLREKKTIRKEVWSDGGNSLRGEEDFVFSYDTTSLMWHREEKNIQEGDIMTPKEIDLDQLNLLNSIDLRIIEKASKTSNTLCWYYLFSDEEIKTRRTKGETLGSIKKKTLSFIKDKLFSYLKDNLSLEERELIGLHSPEDIEFEEIQWNSDIWEEKLPRYIEFDFDYLGNITPKYYLYNECKDSFPFEKMEKIIDTFIKACFNVGLSTERPYIKDIERCIVRKATMHNNKIGFSPIFEDDKIIFLNPTTNVPLIVGEKYNLSFVGEYMPIKDRDGSHKKDKRGNLMFSQKIDIIL